MTVNKKNLTPIALVSIFLLMLALSFAAVPLYDLFCRVTGFGGTTQNASKKEIPKIIVNQDYKMRFDTNVHSIISKDSLKERFSDYYNHDLTEDERLETNDDEIWDYFSDLLNEEDVEMLVLDEIDGVTFAMVSQMPPLYQHKNLKLYEDQNAALQDYIKADFFIQDISSQEEVVKYLSDNVINKPVS